MANAPDAEPLTDTEIDGLFRGLVDARGIVLAVSGGADSTALMHLFARWAIHHPQFASSLVATVDHGLRTDAAAEAALVANQATALGLRHATLRWLGAKPTADLQNVARTARYRLLADAATTEGADTILTAHTLDDQAETFLIALERGSGVYGLAAMPEARMLHGVRIVRPLLEVPKARLVATLEVKSISWSEDPSNADTRFTRVVMRRSAPALAAIGLDARTLAGTARRLARAAAALDIYADRLLTSALVVHAGGFLEVDFPFFAAEPEEVALRAFARALRALTGVPYTPRLDRLERCFRDLLTATLLGKGAQRTLAGVTAVLSPASARLPRPRLWLFAEVGRTGFEEKEMQPGETVDWDRRFRIALSPDAETAVTIRALGINARRLLGPTAPHGVPVAALRTLPGLWREDELVGICCIETSNELVNARQFTARSLVGERLWPARG